MTRAARLTLFLVLMMGCASVDKFIEDGKTQRGLMTPREAEICALVLHDAGHRKARVGGGRLENNPFSKVMMFYPDFFYQNGDRGSAVIRMTGDPDNPTYTIMEIKRFERRTPAYGSPAPVRGPQERPVK